MSRKPAGSAVGGALGSTGPHDSRLIGAVIASLLFLVAPASASAVPQGGPPSITVSIEASTRDCQAVKVDYDIEWQSLTPDSGADPSLIILRTAPDGFTLQSVDFGKKADRTHGKLKGEIVRESGYFDHQTYPALSYQVDVRSSNDAILAQSNMVTIPECVPMTPASGPAAGGTLVTIVGGGTFGDPELFTVASTVTVGGAITVSPTEVARDGTWLSFVAPPGLAGSCVSVVTENPGLPFPLPLFCYGD